jgi:uncharacterized protein
MACRMAALRVRPGGLGVTQPWTEPAPSHVDGLSELFGAASLPLAAPTYGRAADDKTEKKRRVLFFTKSSGFEHDVVKRNSAAPSLSEATLSGLGKQHGFDIVATKDGRIFDGDLTQYDAFFLFTTGDLTEPGTDEMPPMSARGKQALLSAIREGKRFIGVHSASDTFHSKGNRFETQAQPDPFFAMLGGEFLSHRDQQEGRVEVVDPKFPGLEHVPPELNLRGFPWGD